jgi:HPt (histidine-containing phosphotransfer) domain-containing protein
MQFVPALIRRLKGKHVGSLNQKLPFDAPSYDTAVFDFAAFNHTTFGEKNLQQEILQLFLTQLDDTARALATPVDESQWRYLAHTLKGAAAAVGATAIKNIASSWEAHSPPQDPAGLKALNASLASAVEAFRAQANKLIS